MQNLTGNWIGFTHLIFSITSLIFGTLVIVGRKGTPAHKKFGYIYVIAMTLTNLSAFMIYRLFGSFGLFHIAAIFSLATTYSGMIPMWLKKPNVGWKYFHFTFMYWSIIGLYMALVAELMTRIPSTPFFFMVGLAMTIVMIIGLFYYRRMKRHWMGIFGLEVAPKKNHERPN